MRVLCIGNGGVVERKDGFYTTRCNAEFLQELGALVGHVQFCAWLDPTQDPLSQSRLEFEHTGITPLRRIDGTAFNKLFSAFGSFITLLSELVRAQFVYVYWPGGISTVTTTISRILGKPYALYFRGEDAVHQSAFKKAFESAQFVIATGSALCAQASRFCRDVQPVRPMTPITEDHLVPRAPRGDGGPLRLLYVGRLETRKGTGELLEAIATLLEQEVDCTLTLVGHCYEPAEFERWSAKLPTGKAVSTGAIADFKDLSVHYQNADVFILPSHDEGFPRVLYEAMAFGLPIITTFVGSIPTVMEDGRNCLRAEPKNSSDLVAKIKLLRNPELRRQLGENAQSLMRTLLQGWKRTHARQVADKLCRRN